MTKLEEVARALYMRKCDEISADPTSPYRGPFTDFAGLGKAKQAYMDDARAAVEALKIPSEAMIEASNREWDGRMSHRSSGAWQAMLDAILHEEQLK